MEWTNTVIPGGAGFIGSNLTRRLVANGCSVSVIDNLLTGRAQNVPTGINFRQTDVVQRDAFDGLTDVDAVVHLAGASSAPLFDKDPSLASHAVTAFQASLEFARKQDAAVAFASTSSFYSRCQKPYREDMHIVPATLYEFSKLSMEHLAEAYSRTYGLDITAFRFFSVYGPHEQGKGRLANVVSQFLWGLKSGKAPVLFGDGSQTRDFTFVDDLVDAILLATGKPGHNIYNIGTGVEHNFVQLVESLNAALGTQIAPKFVENPIRNYVKETLADNSKLSALGWSPKVNLHEGVRRLVALDDDVDDELLARIAV